MSSQFNSSATTIGPMSVMTSTELAEAESDRQHARRFFWWWLGTATALTLVGNTVHAVLLDIPPTAVKIGVNVIPPVIAFAAIHGFSPWPVRVRCIAPSGDPSRCVSPADPMFSPSA